MNPGETQPRAEPLTLDAVRRVARLSRLALSDEQLEAYRPQLDAILAHMTRLGSLDLGSVEPLTHPLEARNRMDEDVPRPGLPNEAFMAMAPETAPPFLKVPKVLGGGSGGDSGGAAGGGGS